MIDTKFVIGITIVLAAASLSFAKPGSKITKRKLMIDTDAGADDAIAIIMALEIERLYNGPEIIAITCVNGNADLDDVGINVLKTLKTVNRLDIPVYKGASHPLVFANKKDHFFGKDGFGDFNYKNPPSKNMIQKKHAVIAMIELVQKYRGQYDDECNYESGLRGIWTCYIKCELTIITLGPLTNIALAIRMYPPFLNELYELIIMGGSVEGHGNAGNSLEFNFACDPFANFVVFNCTKSKPPSLVPWETVQRARVPIEFRNLLSKLNNAKIRLIDSAEAVSLNQKADYWNCADAVAMAVALTDNSIVTESAAYYSDAIYDGTKTSGLIMVDYANITGNAANVKIIKEINVEVYKEILFRSFSGR